MNQPPKPQNLTPLLVSQGYGAVRWTRHKYVETRPAHLLDREGRPMRDGEIWEHIFECTETGEERRWGNAERNVTAVPPPPGDEAN